MTADKDIVDAGALKDVAAGAAPKKEAPAAEKITLDGAEFEVPPAVAKAIAAARTESEARAAAEATATELRRQLEEKGKPPADKGTGNASDDLETLLFTNPKAALAKVKEEILGEIATNTARSNAQSAFWQQFYEKNPELKAADVLVKALMGQEMTKMGPMTVEKAIDYLAETTQSQLLKLGVTKKGSKKGDPAEGGTEGAGKASKKGETESESSQTGGLSAALKARQEARRQARAG